jgi:hypothetical protein
MYRLAKSSTSYIQIFTRLCLCQVKEQLTENLVHLDIPTNPVSFVHDGHLYLFADNFTLITSESFQTNLFVGDRYN